MTRQAIAQVVAEPEQLGIVAQHPDPTDARAKLVRYTPFGVDGYRRALAVSTELEREQVRRLGADRVARTIGATNDPGRRGLRPGAL